MMRWLFILFVGIGSAAFGQGKVTFRDIAPIIYRSCTPCHRADDIGPMPFTNYAEVRPHIETIKVATQRRYMPPWIADPSYSHFIQERLLTDAEIDMIRRWVDAGAPEGRKVRKSHRSLRRALPVLPAPDTTVCLPRAHFVPGDNDDEYISISAPVRLPRDNYVQAVHFRPGNRRIVHHAWVYTDTNTVDGNVQRHEENAWKSMKRKIVDLLPGYMPGFGPMGYPSGTGKRLYAESQLLFNMHYAPIAIDQTDSSCIDLFFAKAEVKRPVLKDKIYERDMLEPPLMIPAGVVKSFTLRKEIPDSISLINVYPHMHLRGKSMTCYVVTPTADTIPIIRIPAWDFNWQGAYTFPKMLPIPAGSVMWLQASFDNTAENPFNPVLPPVDVRRGNSSLDEMLGLGFEYVKYEKGDENVELSVLPR